MIDVMACDSPRKDSRGSLHLLVLRREATSHRASGLSLRGGCLEDRQCKREGGEEAGENGDFPGVPYCGLYVCRPAKARRGRDYML